jgi:hypothetical protein
MTPSIILPEFFVPKQTLKLGRFITSIDSPHQDYHDPACTTPLQPVISPRDSYTGVHRTDSKSGFGLGLTSLMSAGFSKRAKTKIRVATDCVKTYYLEKSDDWFEEAAGMPATRQWFERKFDRGYDIYMIVGFHTVTDARIIQESVTGTAGGGQIRLPVGLSLAAAGVIVPLGNLIDPSVSGDRLDLEGAQAQFIAPGEQVCALQYRKICHRWLSSKDIDKSRLSKTPQWYSMETSRDEVEGEDDIIEVELTEVHGPDGEWDEEVVGDEVLLIRSYI